MGHYVRLSWDQYFLGIVEAVSLRADCRRRLVGAVLVDNKHIIRGTGYNGVRSGIPGCLEGACPRGLLSYDEIQEFTDYSNPKSPGYCLSSHAEVNAMSHTAGPVQGWTMYVNHAPCPACEKSLFNAGLARVVYPTGELDWRRQ